MKFARLLFCLSVIAVLPLAAAAQQRKTNAENFTAVNLNGQTVELGSLRGKVVVLTFWTIRCAACHYDIPKLNKLTEEYKNQDVVFLAITTDNAANVRKYLKKNRFNYSILPDRFDILLKYAKPDETGKIDITFPTHFLVNRNGEIELRTSGFGKIKQLDNGINQLLAAKPIRVE